MNSQKFFRCDYCGNLVGMLNFSGKEPECCEKPMKTLEASSDTEHFSKISHRGNEVQVTLAATDSPIRWLYLQTEFGGQRKSLHGEGEQQKTFILCDEKPLAVYAYDESGDLQKTDL